MYAALRKVLLVSAASVCGLVSAPLGLSLIANGADHPLSIAALADDDDDDNGHDGAGGSGRDHDDHDDHDRNDRDHDDDDDDDDDQDDDRGPGARDDDDDDHFDDARDPHEMELRVSDESLVGLRNGSLIAVDNLGRVLEVEVEFEHGVRVVTVEPHDSDIHRNPGPIASVSIRPAP